MELSFYFKVLERCPDINPTGSSSHELNTAFVQYYIFRTIIYIYTNVFLCLHASCRR